MPELLPSDPPHLIRMAEAARLAGLSKPAISKAVRSGRLRPRARLMPTSGCTRVVPLFTVDDVVRFAAEREVAA